MVNKSPYPYTLDIASLFADVEACNKAPLSSFKLVDLKVTEDTELLQHKKLAVLEIILKHINDRNFSDTIDVIIKALQASFAAEISDNLIKSTFYYLLKAKEADELKELTKKIDEHIPNLGEEIMSYAEELRFEGMQIGEQRGMQVAQTQIAKEMLHSGIDHDTVARCTHLILKQIKELT